MRFLTDKRTSRVYGYVTVATILLFILISIIPRGTIGARLHAYDKPGDDRINRHDVVYAYGWPMKSSEYWVTHWYGVKRTNVRMPDAQKDWHVNRELAELNSALAMSRTDGAAQTMILRRMKVLAQIPHGNGWVFRWPFAIVNLAAALGLSMLALLLHAVVWRIHSNTKKSRMKRGLCGSCAYDLRGSIGSQQCPECGAKIVENDI